MERLIVALCPIGGKLFVVLEAMCFTDCVPTLSLNTAGIYEDIPNCRSVDLTPAVS